jgi:UDP-N-acetylglucosamine 2-epimerase (non-hydrolysing)
LTPVRIAIVQGTRPEIIKNYSVVKALQDAALPFEVLHTNQHSAARMSSEVYAELGYRPKRTLRVPYRLGVAIDWLQQTFVEDEVTHVIVNGDTAASIAGALAAMYLDIGVTHIEAGLRSGDPHMPEERNRIMVDAIASLLFAYTDVERAELLRTPTIRGRVLLEGNTTVDLLHDFAGRLAQPVQGGRYVFVTLHRKELTDSRQRLLSVFHALRRIAAQHCSVVFPMHPRTHDAVKKHAIPLRSLGNVHVLEPVSTFQSLGLQKHAAAVLTDSGCVQEEAYLLDVPCVTIRDNTERHLTVAHGANVVTGFEPARILEETERALALARKAWPNIYGTAGAGKRIVGRIMAEISESRSAVGQG